MSETAVSPAPTFGFTTDSSIRFLIAPRGNRQDSLSTGNRINNAAVAHDPAWCAGTLGQFAGVARRSLERNRGTAHIRVTGLA
jgi:hypothetical protein